MFQELYQIYSEVAEWFIPTPPTCVCEPPPLDIELLEHQIALMKR